jgi:hypothetical protein
MVPVGSSKMRRRWAVVLSIVALVTGSARVAHAQLLPCSGVAEPGLKILLDDIARSGAAPSPLVDLLAARLDANLEQLRVEAGLNVKVLRCAKRHPASTAVFTRPLVQDLNARQVVLEVWGTTAEVEAEGEKYHEASIGYVVVPIRFHEFAAAEPPGAFVVPRRVKSLDTLDDLVRLVDQAGALAAYAAVGAGTRLVRGRQYDEARVQLCKAQTLLEALDIRPGGPNASLLDYVKRLASDTVKAARSDVAYRGPLKALPESALTSCPGGGR